MLAQTLDRLDLTTAHTVLALLGAGLALYVMQLTSHVEEDRVDPVWLQWGRRLCLAAIALALLWSLSFSVTHSWQPWPPELALIIALNAIFIVRATAIHLRLRRDRLRERRHGSPVRRHA